MDKHQHFAFAGETGAGKTTLLKLIAGLDQPDEGTIFFENKRVLGAEEVLLPGHPKIGYLSQYFELRNHYWIEDLLNYSSKITDQSAKEIYQLCKIQDLLHRKTNQLSGGERQRVALAKILVGSPNLLLLDEPFSNLDPENKKMLKEVLSNLAVSLNISSIMSSHDPIDTLQWADQILVFERGNLIQKDCPSNIYHQPKTAYVAGLFGHYSLLNDTENQFLFNNPIHPFPKDKLLMVRPTDYQIDWQYDDSKNNAEVIKCLFSGLYFEITLKFKTGLPNLLIINTSPIEIGTKISLIYTGKAPCFL